MLNLTFLEIGLCDDGGIYSPLEIVLPRMLMTFIAHCFISKANLPFALTRLELYSGYGSLLGLDGHPNLETFRSWFMTPVDVSFLPRLKNLYASSRHVIKFPDSLERLEFGYYDHPIPTLPSMLKHFVCGNWTLPLPNVLPTRLETLQCHKLHDILPKFPASLTRLECSDFAWVDDNFCSRALKHLTLYDEVSTLPDCENLQVLNVQMMHGSKLPKLPNSLQVLKLEALGEMDDVEVEIPPSLRSLSVKACCRMFCFASFAIKLRVLDISGDCVREMPRSLPVSLNVLRFDDSELRIANKLPPNLDMCQITGHVPFAKNGRSLSIPWGECRIFVS